MRLASASNDGDVRMWDAFAGYRHAGSPAILDSLNRQLAKQPGVTLVAEEARSFLTRAPDRFDVIQMSLVDTWAASAAGAFTLTENGLYTLEAWDVFLGSVQLPL